MATIAKASIQLSASATDVMGELDKVSARTLDLARTVGGTTISPNVVMPKVEVPKIEALAAQVELPKMPDLAPVRVDADTGPAKAKITELMKPVDVQANVSANTADAKVALKPLSNPVEVPVSANTAGVQAGLKGVAVASADASGSAGQLTNALMRSGDVKATVKALAGEIARVGDKAKETSTAIDFDKRLKASGEVGEKLASTFGKARMVASSFQMAVQESGDGVTKIMSLAEAGVSSFSTSMQLATKVASGLKATMLGIGIGAVVTGIGYLIAKLSSMKTETETLLEGVDEKTKAFLESASRGITTDRMRMGPGGLVVRDTTAPTLRPGDVDLARRGVTMSDLATGARSEMAHPGMSRDEREIAAAESRAAYGYSSGDRSAVFMEMRAAVMSAAAAFRELESARRMTTSEGVATSARDAGATMRMSAEEAEMYRLSLRRTTTTIYGVSVATTESISPMEAHARRVTELGEALRRGEISAREYASAIGESERLGRAEEEGLRRTRDALIATARARRLAEVGGVADRARDERMALGRPADEVELERLGRREVESRFREAAMGGRLPGLGDFADLGRFSAEMARAREEMGRLEGARERLRLETPFERLSRALERSSALLRDGRIGFDTFARGAMEGMRDVRTPIERASDEMADLRLREEAVRRAAERTGRTADTTRFDRARDAIRREVVASVTAPGTAAVLKDSLEAFSAIAAARRGNRAEAIAEMALAEERRAREAIERSERRLAEIARDIALPLLIARF